MSTVALRLYPDTPLYTTVASLAGEEFTLRFDYQEKQDRYFLSIYDASGNAIRRGMKCVSNWNVLLQCVDERRPNGLLMFSDLIDVLDSEPAGYRDLGRRVSLLFDDVNRG